ncbi:MAG: redoxin domain-containing protein [bacterium]
MGTEIPSFQTQIYEHYNSQEVEVVAVNQNASRAWLEWYAPLTGFPKNIPVPITFPLLYDQVDDSVGLTFQEYEAEVNLLPSTFVIDQNGIIRLRSDGVTEAAEFELLLEEIKALVDSLLQGGSPNE